MSLLRNSRTAVWYVILGIVGLLLASGGAAFAYETVSVTNTNNAGYAKATAATMDKPTISATVSGSTVKLTLGPSNGTPAATGYTLSVTPSSGSGNGGTCLSTYNPPASATNPLPTQCTYTGVPAGSYTYQLTATDQQWSRSASPSSFTTVTVTAVVVYEAGDATNSYAEVSCPAGYSVLGGGGYIGASTGNHHMYMSGPVTSAVLQSGISGSSVSTLTLTSAGLPFAVASADTLLVGTPGALDTFKVNHTGGYAAGTTSMSVNSQSGTATIPAGSYVFDLTASAWQPATTGTAAPAAASYGWYLLSDSGTPVAHATCTPGNALSTVYEAGNSTTHVAEASCPAGYVAIGGGGFSGAASANHNMFIDGPVTAAVLQTGISGSGVTSLSLTTSTGLPFGVGQGDTMLVGSPGALDTFTINHAGGYGSGTTTIAVNNQSGTATIPAGAYVFDLTATAWRPATSGTGAPTASSYGWFLLNDTGTPVAHAICGLSSSIGAATVNAAASGTNMFVEANCPAGDVAVGGGGYVGQTTGNANLHISAPVTAAVLQTGISGAGVTTLSLTSAGLPFAVSNGDTLLIGSPGALDSFKVNNAAGYAAGATSVSVNSQSGTSTIPAGSYVFDPTASAWQPSTSGTAAPTTSPVGWYVLSDVTGSEVQAICAP